MSSLGRDQPMAKVTPSQAVLVAQPLSDEQQQKQHHHHGSSSFAQPSTTQHLAVEVKGAREWAQHPEESADCCARNTLGWLTNLMDLGLARAKNKDSLYLEDLGRVAAQDEARAQGDKFDALWTEEVGRVRKQNDGAAAAAAAAAEDISSDGKANGKANTGKQKAPQSAKASLIKVWFRFIGLAPFTGLVLLKVLDAASVTMAPLINKQLILYLENSTDNYYDELTGTPPSAAAASWCGANRQCSTWQLVLLVLGLYLSQLVSGAIRSFTDFQSKRMAMHSYAALSRVRVTKKNAEEQEGEDCHSAGRPRGSSEAEPKRGWGWLVTGLWANVGASESASLKCTSALRACKQARHQISHPLFAAVAHAPAPGAPDTILAPHGTRICIEGHLQQVAARLLVRVCRCGRHWAAGEHDGVGCQRGHGAVGGDAAARHRGAHAAGGLLRAHLPGEELCARVDLCGCV
jgi:hypothetical protein